MIGITLGDPGGIGIEVVLRALPYFSCEVLLFGNTEALKYYSDELDISVPESVEIIDIKGEFYVGEVRGENGDIAYHSIIEGIKTCKEGICDALVTAPISKKSLAMAGYGYPGHTEILAEECRAKRYAMMMVSEEMKVVFVTTHIPISEIHSALTKEGIVEKVELAHYALIHYWKIEKPGFGILGLNPHSGDRGLFGTEESEIIEPAVAELKSRGFNVEGPFPPDTYWVTQKKDCSVALYHDQGMIPFKLSGMGKGVNVTLGLPFIRTSPDHGTAFDIAGKGLANPESMRKSLETALFLTNA